MTGAASRDWLHQVAYEVRLEWGPRGAQEGARRGDVVVVVDVLSFTTTVTAALAHGASIVPFPWGDPDAAAREAERLGVRLLTGDGEPETARRSLSPLGFGEHARGETYLLSSPNGATCAHVASAGGITLLGCLRNAEAVATAAAEEARTRGVGITVVPCGERWPERADPTDQGMRPCVEDHLGAGAITFSLVGRRSPEAGLAADAFRAARDRLAPTLRDCVSGRELHARGYGDDVGFAAALNATEVVPRLAGDRFPAP